MFKNQKMAVKLLLIVIPLDLLCLLLLFATIYSTNNALQDSKSIYYDHLYKLQTELINTDRDFYQAEMAASDYYGMGDEVDADTLKSMI